MKRGNIITGPFNSLPVTILADILKLKEACFSYTNNPEVTGWDKWDDSKGTLHLVTLLDDFKVAAYGRICPPDTFLKQSSFSRICCDPDCRGNGYGKDLIAKAIYTIGKIYDTPVEIKVRTHMVDYYQKLGFVIQNDRPIQGVSITECFINQ